MFMTGATMKGEKWILNLDFTNNMSKNNEQLKTLIAFKKPNSIKFKNGKCLDADLKATWSLSAELWMKSCTLC